MKSDRGIYEPLLQAAGGMRMYNAHMDDLLNLFNQKKILCTDEVLTGFEEQVFFASES
jgi:adenosylmethionine-8-amino-7-oxononanoate aminotransferase